MVCLECGSDKLLGKITIERYVPLAARGGSVKVGGVAVTQIDLKNAWDKEANSDTEKAVKTPIFCDDCGMEHHYITGDKNPLRKGPFEPCP